METVCLSETSVHVYRATKCYIPERGTYKKVNIPEDSTSQNVFRLVFQVLFKII
jgi:hypothetical protein